MPHADDGTLLQSIISDQQYPSLVAHQLLSQVYVYPRVYLPSCTKLGT